jgi:hypothetical protein
MRSPAFNRAIHKAYRKINKLPDHEPKNGGGSKSAPTRPDHKPSSRKQEPVLRDWTTSRTSSSRSCES